MKGDNADHGRQGAALLVSADTEAGDTGQGEGKIVIAGLVQSVDIPVVCQLVNFFQKLFRVWRQHLFFIFF